MLVVWQLMVLELPYADIGPGTSGGGGGDSSGTFWRRLSCNPPVTLDPPQGYRRMVVVELPRNTVVMDGGGAGGAGGYRTGFPGGTKCLLLYGATGGSYGVKWIGAGAAGLLQRAAGGGGAGRSYKLQVAIKSMWTRRSRGSMLQYAVVAAFKDLRQEQENTGSGGGGGWMSRTSPRATPGLQELKRGLES